MLPPPEPSRRTSWLPYLLLLFPLALILPGLGDFAYPPGEALFSDIPISHFPAAVMLKNLIQEYRQLPLWSPHLFSGAPLAANPLYSLYYPPAWLALILPLPAGFNLLVILHLMWGGLGMLRLLQAEGLRWQAAVLGALSFIALPKLYAHYGAGHLTLLYAVPWTPWLLLAWKMTGTASYSRRWRVPAGAILGVIFLADPRWAAYAGLLWLGYAVTRWVGLPGWGARRQDLGQLLIHLLLAALIAAPLALPLLEFTRLTTRAHLTPADNLEFSLPLARLLGLLIPSLGGTHEYELYSGALVLLLAVLACFWGAVRKRASFWLAAAVLSLLWALGENLPGLSGLASLPGFDLLRVPSRSLFITGMAISALAAYAVDAFLAETTPPKRLGLVLASLAFFVLLLAFGSWAISGQTSLNLVWGALLLVVSAIWAGLRLRGRLTPRPWWVGCLVLILIDLGIADQKAFAFHPFEQVLGEKRALVEYLESQPGLFRVYSPSYSLPQQVTAAAGLEHAGGVDPLQIQAYASFFARAAGTPLSGYSISLPPFASADPAVDNRSAVPDASQLGLLNVAYVAAEYPLAAPGLEWVGEFTGTQLYQNTRVLPRAWLQPGDSPLGESIQPVSSLEWSPNRIVVRLDPPPGQSLQLVFSEIAYPGWRAWIDGQPAALEAAGGLLRSVMVPGGAHEVVLKYRPLSVVIGLLLGILGVVFTVIAGRLSRKQTGPRSFDQVTAP
ncbi:MAG TPA: hypothetical protein VN363_07505 [Anaerolineales bacterium]|nr:hypothetical protein [Anaerolineales bacterium]